MSPGAISRCLILQRLSSRAANGAGLWALMARRSGTISASCGQQDTQLRDLGTGFPQGLDGMATASSLGKWLVVSVQPLPSVACVGIRAAQHIGRLLWRATRTPTRPR